MKGSVQVAAFPLSEYTNMLITGITRDLSGIVDPIDLIFGIFKIELTDGWTLFYMAVLMGFGIPAQIRSIEQQGFSLDTPVIVYDTEDRSKHGKIERR